MQGLRPRPLRRLDTGALLGAARRTGGLTQSELARAVGTTQSAVSRWEAGADVPRIDRLATLLAACGVEADVTFRHHDDVDRAQIRAHLALTPKQRLAAVRNVATLRHRVRSARAGAVRP